jgi:alkylation response protein AidB-like acyl-CoA dehydrogenase
VDLTPTDDQIAFRTEARAWLEASVPPEPLPSSATEEGFAAHREWERTRYDAGYAAISWPEEYGGRDAELLTQAIFSEDYSRAGP